MGSVIHGAQMLAAVRARVLDVVAHGCTMHIGDEHEQYRAPHFRAYGETAARLCEHA
jgi:hypothetical protein